jgi:hypothetical protein
MKVTDKLKSVIRRRPLTKEELAARAEAENRRERALEEEAGHASLAHKDFPPL